MNPNEQGWLWARNTGLAERGHPLFADDGQVLEADNIAWLTEGAMQMRLGSESESLSGSSITGEVQWLFNWLPADGDPEETWCAGNNSGTVVLVRRITGTWNSVSIPDPWTANSLRFTHAAALNGKLFIAYDSDVNRLHVYDPNHATPFRRVGLRKPSAPSVADTGSGSYTATARRYRVSTRIKTGTTIEAESELSEATSFTPSGSGTAARVSRPVTYESTATHWVVWGLIGSSGDTYDLYEELSEIAIATTTYDDSTAPSSYDGDFPPELGLNIPPPSCKFIVSDSNRLLMAGAWESSGDTDQTTPKVNRVWFTRVLGASDRGDDESVPVTETLRNYIDVGDAAPITGLAVLLGRVYVFKSRAVYELVATGDSTTPYAQQVLTEACGAVNQRVICDGTDAAGNPAIYFADEHALFRISYGGLEPIDEGIARDLRASAFEYDTSLLKFDPYQKHVLLIRSSSPSSVSGSYNAFMLDVLKQRWSGFSIGGAQGGWTLNTSALGTSSTLAGAGSSIITATVATNATTDTRRLLLGGQDADSAGVITSVGGQCALDGATTFTSTVRVRKMLRPGFKASAQNPTIWYVNPQGSTSGTLTCTLSFLRPAGPNGESDAVTQSVTLDATTDESGVEMKEFTFGGVSWADFTTLDLKLTLSYSGTAFSSAQPPAIHAVYIPMKMQEPLSR
jgi:hypothetical protein